MIAKLFYKSFSPLSSIIIDKKFELRLNKKILEIPPRSFYSQILYFGHFENITCTRFKTKIK